MQKQELTDILNLKSISSNFKIYGDYVKSDSLGFGHINSTYKTLYNQGGTIVPYVFQKINTAIFSDPYSLTDNIVKISTYQKEYYKNHKDASRRHLTPIQTKDELYYHIDSNNNFWRAFFCIESAISYDIIKDEEAAFKAAKAFGAFQKSLEGLENSSTLVETIPDFHNTPKRFEAFEKAVELDRKNRAKDVSYEINFALARKKDCDVLYKMHKEGIIQERIIHNDTKLNNIMFDIQTEDPICVLDLDLVMPGFSAYDYGDMLRCIGNPVAEDEQDLSKVEMQFSIFAAVTNGFISEAGKFLPKKELMSLPYGAHIISLELACRFLMDHLNGDTYFKISRPNHNLDRARTQFKMVESIEKQWDKIMEFTDNIVRQS